ncbi:MAG: DksA/TraR family C4-type zinc finger protein [Flavobacteriia bacterium]|nr:DksA/TraR family C4-type zinc finger protein [Flavobacteriia bacterium]
MSGYLGNPDAGAEYASDVVDAHLRLIRSRLSDGVSSLICHDCGDEIPEGRRLAQPGCMFCVQCQVEHDKLPRLNFLTKML